MSLWRSSLKLVALTNSVHRLPNTAQTRCFKRWVAPTLRELRKRSEQLGDQGPQPRSSFVEWNYRAELFAFGKRLQENFPLPLLQTAFTQRSYIEAEKLRQRELGIEEADMQMKDNSELAQRGCTLIEDCVRGFLQHSLPKVPAAGQEALTAFLLSTETLAHVGLHLGMKELIFSADYPPKEEVVAQCLCAVIGALAESSGVERAFLFVRDFVCTQLNQRDLLELWEIDNPEALLRKECKERKMAEPEPRLLGDCGRNTVLAAYHVGMYVDKKLLGKGFGEDVETAVKTASLDALQQMYDIPDNRRPFDFQLQVKPKSQKQLN